MRNVSLPENLNVLSNGIFSYCFHLEKIDIPKSVEEIGWYAFGGCSSLKEITLPENLKKIGECAFTDCEKLERIKIPEQVTRIENLSFAQCRALKELDMPSKMSFITSTAFQNCNALSNITCRSVVPPESDNDVFFYSFLDYKNCKLYIPTGTTSAYQASQVFSKFINIEEKDFSTTIISPKINKDGMRVFRLDGSEERNIRKGMNIIRNQNQSVHKVIVR